MSRFEERIRAAEERAKGRVQAAANCHSASPAERGTWAEYRERMDSLRKEIDNRFQSTGSYQSKECGPLDRIFLERALSALKHGLVESCFYNLRILAQKVALDRGSQDLSALTTAGERVPTVRKELGLFLQGRVPCGILVADLLPDLASVFLKTLPLLEGAVVGGLAMAKEIPALVDAVLSGIAREADSLRSQRLSLFALVRRALEIEGPRLQEADMDVSVENEVEDDRIHADEPRLLDTIVELLRNAAVHREGSGRGKVVINLRPRENYIHLVVSSRPALPPLIPLNRLFETGVSRREGGGDGLATVQRTLTSHGGRAELQFSCGSGTFDVCLALPTRLPV
jgi:signal transduction histidine kinase